jgi:hypothetical protein
MNDEELKLKLKTLLKEVKKLDVDINCLILKRNSLLDIIEKGTAYLMVRGKI